MTKLIETIQNYINNIFSSKKNYYLTVLILIIIFSIMRVTFIESEAPQDLSKSGALYSDEGFKTYSSRNKVLFNNWKWSPEDQYSGWLKGSPVSAYSYKFIFDIFGTGFISIRLLSIFYSVFTMIVLFLFCKRYFDDKTALIALLIFGTNFFNVMFNKLGFYEVHINFYFIIALFLFTETFFASKKPISILLFCLGIVTFLITFFIKKSSPIVIFSIVPAIILYLCHRKGLSSKKIKSIFTIILISVFIIYLFFGHAFQLKALLNFTKAFKIAGYSLGDFLPVRTFDPFYLFLPKLFHLEFIFLHPFTFFITLIYAVYTFFQYPKNEKNYNIDFFLSSWFFFGFLILSFLTYHPARYYILLIIPMIILFARAILSINYMKLIDFYKMEKPLLYKIIIKVIKIIVMIYAGVIVVMQLLPFSFRSFIKDTFYIPLMTGNIPALLPVVIPVVVFLGALISFIIIKRKKIDEIICWDYAPKLFLTLIIILQLFQYGSWMIFNEKKVYSLSKKMGEQLPANSIIAGSWSAQLVVENNLRALVLQHKGKYNYSVMEKIIKNEPILIYEQIANKTIIKEIKDLPLYIAVSPDIIFEKKIVEKYKEYFVPERLSYELSVGYYNLEIYRIR